MLFVHSVMTWQIGNVPQVMVLRHFCQEYDTARHRHYSRVTCYTHSPF